MVKYSKMGFFKFCVNLLVYNVLLKCFFQIKRKYKYFKMYKKDFNVYIFV